MGEKAGSAGHNSGRWVIVGAMAHRPGHSGVTRCGRPYPKGSPSVQQLQLKTMSACYECRRLVGKPKVKTPAPVAVARADQATTIRKLAKAATRKVVIRTPKKSTSASAKGVGGSVWTVASAGLPTLGKRK